MEVTPQRFIPFRRRDVVDMCLSIRGCDPDEADDLRDVARILGAIFHFEHHERLEALKDAYAPLDPDPDTRMLAEPSPEERREARQRFTAELRALLEAANFEEVTEEDLSLAFDSESLLDIRLKVDFDDFEEVTFYRRGEELRTEEVARLWGLRRRQVRFRNLERVVVSVRFKDRDHFEARGRKDLPFEPGSTILKLFQNIPRADLEMLFPNVEVRMRPIDKLVIGVPAVISGMVILFTKLIASLGLVLLLLAFWLGLREEDVALSQGELLALGASLGATGGFLVRQFNKFKNRKIRFMKALADDLYFKNLDNDAGVFHNLIDAAEDEEIKETLLGYCFLLRGGPQTPAELDAAIEGWLAERWGCTVDFEIADSVAKLERLGLATAVDGRYTAIPPGEARSHLDATWDAYFPWSDSTARGRTSG